MTNGYIMMAIKLTNLIEMYLDVISDLETS